MTELHIDRQPVVLPENFSFELIQENPFFTKNGKYTFDIELSLDSPENAKLYRHLNRIHNKIPVPLNRSACLIVDNEVILNGLEIIEEITDKSVKIQLASGESELNFLTGSDRKINTLDLGSVDDDIQFTPNNALLDTHFKAKVLWIPVYSSNEKQIINEYIVYDYLKETGGNPDGNIVRKAHLRKFLPQPFLYHIVNKIIENLGYTVASNFIEEHWSFKWLYLVNGIHTKKYNKMLPDWTVRDFFEEIEKLFNVAFVIYDESKTVRIMAKNKFYSQNQKTVIDRSFDEFINTIDNEQKQDYFNANIGYELPDDEYFKFQNIEESILTRAVKEDLDSYNQIVSTINASADKPSLKNRIYTSLQSGQQYICADVEFNENGNTAFRPKKVNAFRPLKNNNNSNDIDISLKITPAPMKNLFIPVRTVSYDPPDNPYEEDSLPWISGKFYVAIQIPVIQTSNYTLKGPGDFMIDSEDGTSFTYDDSDTYYDEEDHVFLDIQDEIEGNDDKDKKADVSPGNIQLAFFDMIYATQNIYMNNYSAGNRVLYPISFTDYTWDFLPDAERFASTMTLRLTGNFSLNELLYNQSAAIDTTKEFKIKFLNQRKLDAKSIFVINNKNFVCKQLKYVIAPDGFDEIVEGVFYEIL